MKQDKEKKHIGHKEIAEKASDRLYSAAKAPWYGYIAFLFIYILASVLITIVSRSDGTMLINGNRIPLSAFAGVFSSLSNICIIMLVISYGTLGFVTSLVMMLLQFPVILTSILKHNIVGNIPRKLLRFHWAMWIRLIILFKISQCIKLKNQNNYLLNLSK